MRKKGVALLWTLVLSAVLLIISSTMVSYIIKESRFSVNIEESSVAYAAAKSGVEWGLNKREVEGVLGAPIDISFDLINTGDGEDTRVIINPNSPDCVGGTLISSESASGSVTRRLEYCFTESAPNIIDLSGLGSTVLDASNYNSFVMSFDFWFSSSGSATNGYTVGADNSADTSKYIRARIDNGSVLFEASNGVINKPKTISKDIFIEPSHDQAYKLKGKIQYIEDTAAKLTIFKLESNQYICIATATLDLNDFFTNENLNSLNVEGPGYPPAYTTSGAEGDGSYLYFGGDGYKTIYIDNVVFEN